MLIAKKNIEMIVATSIKSYDDGSSLYLKTDESGKGRIVSPTFADIKSGKEIKFGEFTDEVNFNIDRYDNTFILKSSSPYSESVTFITINEGKALKIRYSFTKLISFDIVKGKYVLMSSYENLENDERIYQAGIYDMTGKLIKSMLDERVNGDIKLNFMLDERAIELFCTKGRRKEKVSEIEFRELEGGNDD